MKKEYSGKQIIKAGETLIQEDIYTKERKKDLNKAINILSYWRFSHEYPLERALELLEDITIKKDKTAIFAKRLKRYASIISKLKRFDQMKLKNMQDIGGCRAIVGNPKKLYQVVRELKKRPEFKDSKGKVRFKDYLKTPKLDGYRSYHLIGQLTDEKNNKKNIELQIRTRLQHDWATALEIVDLFTGQALKSNIGDNNWKEFFKLVSNQFAIMDDIHLFDTFSDNKKHDEFIKKLNTKNHYIPCHRVRNLEFELEVIKKLEAFAHSVNFTNNKLESDPTDGYVLITINTHRATINHTIYDKKDNEQAEKDYVFEEKRALYNRDLVVALVSTTAIAGIKEAYPNYFADSKDFIKHLAIILSASYKDHPVTQIGMIVPNKRPLI